MKQTRRNYNKNGKIKANTRVLKYVFVTGKENIAKEVIIKKRIGHRSHRWRVREVNTIPRCYKCHRVGHKANKCKMQDEEKRLPKRLQKKFPERTEMLLMQRRRT